MKTGHVPKAIARRGPAGVAQAPAAALLGAALLTATLLVGALLATAPTAGASPAGRIVPADPADRFAAVDVFIDPGGRSLASFQLEVTDPAGSIEIVGIEGGDHPAFREPPFYDPAALGAGRIIIAAFSTAAELPRSRTRVASLHLLVRGVVAPELDGRLEIATDSMGREIPVTIELEGARP